MFKSAQEVKEYCQENEIKMIDFKVSDMTGRWHHLSQQLDLMKM